jgi:hypothetical protein
MLLLRVQSGLFREAPKTLISSGKKPVLPGPQQQRPAGKCSLLRVILSSAALTTKRSAAFELKTNSETTFLNTHAYHVHPDEECHRFFLLASNYFS